jgi:hypothetical protein
MEANNGEAGEGAIAQVNCFVAVTAVGGDLTLFDHIRLADSSK